MNSSLLSQNFLIKGFIFISPLLFVGFHLIRADPIGPNVVGSQIDEETKVSAEDSFDYDEISSYFEPEEGVSSALSENDAINPSNSVMDISLEDDLAIVESIEEEYDEYENAYDEDIESEFKELPHCDADSIKKERFEHF